MSDRAVFAAGIVSLCLGLAAAVAGWPWLGVAFAMPACALIPFRLWCGEWPWSK